MIRNFHRIDKLLIITVIFTSIFNNHNMQIKINVSANEFDNCDTHSNKRYPARVFDEKSPALF